MIFNFYSCSYSRSFRRIRCQAVVRSLTVQFLIIVLGLSGGCAVFDKSRPGWDKFNLPRSEEKVSLHYETMGEGKPVVLVHGFAASAYTWLHLAPELAKTHKVYLIDLKGFGKSPKPDDRAYSVYDQAHLVIDLIKEQGLKDVTLVGHSFGGGVALVSALYLTRSMPGLLEKLVLIDNVAYSQEIPFFIEVLATPVIGMLVANLTPATVQVRNVLDKAYYNDDLITDDAVTAYAAPLKNADAVNAMLTTASSILPADLDKLSREYPTLHVPTQIIWGDHDEIVPLSVGEKLHEAIKDSDFHVIKSCGHIPQEECPEQTIPLIVDFLK